MNKSVAEKLTNETKQLMKVRGDFVALKKEEEQYLKDRELKAQSHLQNIHRQITSAEKVLEGVRNKIINKIKDLGGKVSELVEGLYSMLDRAEKIYEQSEDIKKNTDKTGKHLDDAYDSVLEKIKEVSEFETVLKKREKEVEVRDEKATEKLEKAKNLAYWHKTGKRYKED